MDQSGCDVTLFRGHKHPLSNMYPVKIDIWGMSFRSTEHAYQFRKAMHLKQFDIASCIRGATSAYEAMRLSKLLKPDRQWHCMKVDVMREVIEAKLCQCKEFRVSLLSSMRNEIIEDTGNHFWGRGHGGKGLNRLGRLLMSVRDCELDYLSGTPVCGPSNGHV